MFLRSATPFAGGALAALERAAEPLATVHKTTAGSESRSFGVRTAAMASQAAASGACGPLPSMQHQRPRELPQIMG